MTKNCHILERFQAVKCLVGHQPLDLLELGALNRKERCQTLEQGPKMLLVLRAEKVTMKEDKKTHTVTA